MTEYILWPREIVDTYIGEFDVEAVSPSELFARHTEAPGILLYFCRKEGRFNYAKPPDYLSSEHKVMDDDLLEKVLPVIEQFMQTSELFNQSRLDEIQANHVLCEKEDRLTEVEEEIKYLLLEKEQLEEEVAG